MNFNFNHSFIYWEMVKNHNIYKKDILSKIFEIKNNKALLKKELFTKYDSYKNYYISIKYDKNSDSLIYKDDGGQDLINFDTLIDNAILPAFDRMVQEMNLKKPIEREIKAIWCNYYEKGGYHGLHHHEKSDISGVYLLHLEEPNLTNFYSYNDCLLQTWSKDTKDIEEGNIIFFPSHLLHEAKATDTARVTISFDIICDVDTYKESLI
jgi:hypothetical protein